MTRGCPLIATRRSRSRKRETNSSAHRVEFGVSTIREIALLSWSASRQPVCRQEFCEMVQVDIVDVLFAAKVVLHRHTIWMSKSGDVEHSGQRAAKSERRQVELDSRESFDEIEHSLLLHEGTGLFLGITRPVRGRDVGNMEPHGTCKRTRVVHDGRPVPPAFVVSLERGRGPVGNYDWSVIRQSTPGRIGANIRTTQDSTEDSEQGALDGHALNFELVDDRDDCAPGGKHNHPMPAPEKCSCEYGIHCGEERSQPSCLCQDWHRGSEAKQERPREKRQKGLDIAYSSVVLCVGSFHPPHASQRAGSGGRRNRWDRNGKTRWERVTHGTGAGHYHGRS